MLSFSFTHMHTHKHKGAYANPLKPQGWSLPRGLVPLSQSPRLWGWSPDLPLPFLPFLTALRPPQYVPIIFLPG